MRSDLSNRRYLVVIVALSMSVLATAWHRAILGGITTKKIVRHLREEPALPDQVIDL